jgi:hypothetical protein
VCRDYVQRGLVKLLYVPTASQFADLFTKQLGPAVFRAFRARFMAFISYLR